MKTFSQWAGPTLYRLYYEPLGKIEALFKAGGPLTARRTKKGHRAMEQAARLLPPLPASKAAPVVELHLLTGKRFWDQTAFCLYSFARDSGRAIAPVLYDDGSLAEPEIEVLQRLFSRTRIVNAKDASERLDALLPRARFPVLRERWDNYPNLRKLIAPHLGAKGWKLVLDSDLLFFRRPDFLIDWLDAPTQPLHAVDSETSYGYSRALLRSVATGDLAERLNVGLCGLKSETIDWERLEAICRRLHETEGMHYYLEQALVAVLLAGQACAIAPENEYVTLPRLPEARACRATMHHYVANSKRWYFQTNWRRFAPS